MFLKQVKPRPLANKSGRAADVVFFETCGRKAENTLKANKTERCCPLACYQCKEDKQNKYQHVEKEKGMRACLVIKTSAAS